MSRNAFARDKSRRRRRFDKLTQNTRPDEQSEWRRPSQSVQLMTTVGLFQSIHVDIQRTVQRMGRRHTYSNTLSHIQKNTSGFRTHCMYFSNDMKHFRALHKGRHIVNSHSTVRRSSVRPLVYLDWSFFSLNTAARRCASSPLRNWLTLATLNYSVI